MRHKAKLSNMLERGSGQSKHHVSPTIRIDLPCVDINIKPVRLKILIEMIAFDQTAQVVLVARLADGAGLSPA